MMLMEDWLASIFSVLIEEEKMSLTIFSTMWIMDSSNDGGSRFRRHGNEATKAPMIEIASR